MIHPCKLCGHMPYLHGRAAGDADENSKRKCINNDCVMSGCGFMEPADWGKLMAPDPQIALLKKAYQLARNSAAGYSNYCDDSANTRICEKELEEAERVFRNI